MSRLPLLILLLPIVEIAAFILVGGEIGVLPTIGLTLLATLVGGILLRVQGFGAMRRIQKEMDAGNDPGREMAHGAMIMLAGILLLIPGFVTDIFGLLLFVPFIRDVAWRFLRKRLNVVTSFQFGFPGASQGSQHRGRTIDLDEDDYERRNDREPRTPIGRDD